MIFSNPFKSKPSSRQSFEQKGFSMVMVAAAIYIGCVMFMVALTKWALI